VRKGSRREDGQEEGDQGERISGGEGYVKEHSERGIRK
jgi:hypothetical protein